MTPLAGHKTMYHIPAAGRLGLAETDVDVKPFTQVGATIQGSLNQPTDRDTGWTAEMVIPLDRLQTQDAALSAASDWSMLVARYNYSRYTMHRGPELTSAPALSKPSFHLFWEYAKIRFEQRRD